MVASVIRRVSSQLCAAAAARIFSPFSSSLPSSFSLGPSTAIPTLPRSSPGSSMELMAVPKKKVSRYKRGLRNGPKALKPIPVIVRCKCCGRVKLPHFYCCSGDRGSSGPAASSG